MYYGENASMAPSTIDLTDDLLTSKSNVYRHHINSSCGQERNFSGVSNAFTGKSLKNPVNCSKSLFASTSRVNLPPAISSPLVQSPPPLTVMGYRSDLFATQQKQLSAHNKNNVKGNNQTNKGDGLRSSSSMKCTIKNPSYRWKSKSNNFKAVDLYPDPLVDGDPAFTQRISEMAALEMETIKYEKARKFRRK